MKKALIIDDEEMVRKSLKNKFPPQEYSVFETKSLDEALNILNRERDIDVAIVDLRLMPIEEEGKETGLGFIRPSMMWKICHQQRLGPKPIVIVLTAYPNIQSCKKAIKDGAYDYLDKNDSDVYNKLMESIKQGLEQRGSLEEYEDRIWFEKHFDEIVNKYKGKRIAIHKGKVIASGDTVDELNKILREKFRDIKPFLVYIPKEN